MRLITNQEMIAVAGGTVTPEEDYTKDPWGNGGSPIDNIQLDPWAREAPESSGGSTNNMRQVEANLQLAALALAVAAAATIAIPPVSASLGVSAAGVAGLSFVAGAYK